VRRDIVGTWIRESARWSPSDIECSSAWSQGGMGAVYRGEHIELGRDVAIKFLHEWAATEPSFVKRFERRGQGDGAAAAPRLSPR
jgi:hypothetical protein